MTDFPYSDAEMEDNIFPHMRQEDPTFDRGYLYEDDDLSPEEGPESCLECDCKLTKENTKQNDSEVCLDCEAKI